MQIAPNVGAMPRPTSMMSSGRLLLTQIGKASMPAKVLKMTLLPSAMGRAASAGPISRPKISEPSVRMATVFPRQVRSNEERASWLMARQA